MTTFLPYVLAAAGGYVASVFTWPAIRTVVVGVETEVASLRARAAAISAAARAPTKAP